LSATHQDGFASPAARMGAVGVMRGLHLMTHAPSDSRVTLRVGTTTKG
jgi:hypothetical protein